ncbi:hypothetical protein [Microvirga sp. G4-2]|uniref:hypothetical protein n=1 Tax=Microvirga sp. G4-2 TaxID=3434467 RepID=UPI0040446D9A
MMAEAPLVEDYELFNDCGDMHLRGILHGSPDPRHEDGARFVSGVIQVADEEEGWAISYHGSYRLGAPLRPADE